MQAKLIATLSGLTTLENKTTTVEHLVEIDGDLYLIELLCTERLDSIVTPRKVQKLLVKEEVVLGKGIEDAVRKADDEAIAQ